MPRPRGMIEDWTPKPDTLALIRAIQGVLDEYQAQLPLTLRQVFYRLVGAHGYAKTEAAYKRLCEVANRARRASMLPWSSLRDDGGRVEIPFSYAGIEHALASARNVAKVYRLDRQAGQQRRLYLMCEAGGMVPQMVAVADEFGVEVRSSGGFDSVTEKHTFAEVLAEDAMPATILHVGDHDPSGVHIFQNLAEDVSAFAAAMGCLRPEFVRIAVTPDQIEAMGLITAPAKDTDRRSFAGVGDDPNATVQAEAIPPDELAKLVRAEIEKRLEPTIRLGVIKQEKADQRYLIKALGAIRPTR